MIFQTGRLHNGKRVLLKALNMPINGMMIVVPQGFVTDFSSYPSFTRFIVRFDRVDVAGVVHDFLYSEGKLSRSQCDKIWYEVAVRGQCSANKIQGWISWAGLRLFGWIAWRSHRKASMNIY